MHELTDCFKVLNASRKLLFTKRKGEGGVGVCGVSGRAEGLRAVPTVQQFYTTLGGLNYKQMRFAIEV